MITQTLLTEKIAKAEEALKENDILTFIAIQEDIIASKNSNDCYLFALNFNYIADINSLEEVIINNKDAKHAILFARNVKRANIERLGLMVAKTDNISYNEEFMTIIGADIDLHEKRIKQILKARHKTMLKLLKIVGKNKTAKLNEYYTLARQVIKQTQDNLYNGNYKEVYEIQDAVINSKDGYIAYAFAKAFQDEIDLKLEEIENVVLEEGNPKICTLFARDIKGASVRSLGNIVLNCEDIKLNTEFLYIKGADTISHTKRINELKNKENDLKNDNSNAKNETDNKNQEENGELSYN